MFMLLYIIQRKALQLLNILTNYQKVSKDVKYQWHIIGIQLEMNWLLIG